MSVLEAGARALMACLGEGVEGSEGALKELEGLVKSIGALRVEYEKVVREQALGEVQALDRVRELAAQLDRHERALESIALRCGLPAWRAGLSRLTESLEAVLSRGGGVGELLEVLRVVGELERVYELAGLGRGGGGALRADGLLVIREYVKEALYRALRGGDPSGLLGEALSVARALRELEALAAEGARLVSLEDLEVVGYVDGKPVYALRRGDSPGG